MALRFYNFHRSFKLSQFQAHPTNGRRYSLYLPLLIISWVGLAGATIHLLTSGASYWQQGADDVQNGADRAYPLRAVSGIFHFIIFKGYFKNMSKTFYFIDLQISKRQAQERNVFELFEDSDYDGDFEKVGDTSSQAFVIAQPKSLRNFSTDTKSRWISCWHKYCLITIHIFRSRYSEESPLQDQKSKRLDHVRSTANGHIRIRTDAIGSAFRNFLRALSSWNWRRAFQKTSNGDTNSIADQPFQLIRPSARGDKQRHFVKVRSIPLKSHNFSPYSALIMQAIHGPFVWDTFSDGSGRNVHRHDSTTKVVIPLVIRK